MQVCGVYVKSRPNAGAEAVWVMTFNLIRVEILADPSGTTSFTRLREPWITGTAKSILLFAWAEIHVQVRRGHSNRLAHL